MAVVTVSGAASTKATTNNNHGVAQNVGNSSTVLSSRPLGDAVRDIAGSVVIDGADTNEAVAAGVIAYNNQKPTAQRLPSTRGGVASATLLSGGDVSLPNRGINKKESVKSILVATAIRNNQYNRYTGLWSSTPTSQDDSAMVANDVAANPSRDIPGHLTFKLGQPVAETVNYAKKTN